MPLILLLTSIAALGLGPMMVQWSAPHGRWRRALDGFVTLGVGGLVLFHILPPAMTVGGYPALVFLVAGAMLPTAIERIQYGHVRTAHAAALTLAFVALAIHAASDGLVMASASGTTGWAFSAALAVILHRIPVGIAAWVFLRRSQSMRWAGVVFGLIIVGTVIGFVAGAPVLRLMQDTSFAWFQAFVAGSLLHVVLHAHEHDHHFDHGDPRGHGHDHVHVTDVAHVAHHRHGTHTRDAHEPHDHNHALRCVTEQWDKVEETKIARIRSFLGVDAILHQLPEVFGAAMGVGLLFFLAWMEGHAAGDGHAGAHHYTHLAHVAGGVDVQALGASAWLRFRHLALDGALWLLVGYVLSAGVFRWTRLPGVAWLRTRSPFGDVVRGSVYGAGMPVRACGVVPVFGSLHDRGVRWPAALSFLLTTPQLRMETVLFSIPLLGLPLTGIRIAGIWIAAIMVGLVVGTWLPEPEMRDLESAQPPRMSWWSAWHQALVRLVDDTAPWIVVGLLAAALIPPGGFAWATALPIGWSLLMFAVLGVPLYICATGATPVALALMYVGFSPGAALVLLLSGPITVWSAERAIRVRSSRVGAWLVLSVTWLLLTVLGLVTHMLLAHIAFTIRPMHQHTAGTAWQWMGVIAVALLFAWSLLRRGPRAWLNIVIAGDHG